MEKKLIMDDLAIQRSLKRITHEIIEHNKGADNIILVGIRSRGVYLARRLAALIRSFEQVEIPVYALDVSFWRDDHKRTQSRSEAIPVQDRKVILVDDVLFKGRTIRAAMDAICDMGRPSCIQLAVMVDRGHRELPIRADYVGKNLPTSKNELVGVRVPEFDGDMSVVLYDKRSE